MRAVLRKLKAAELYLNIKKCKFEIKSIKYFDLIITDERIKIDPAKIKII
jgi:hypothetical protein